MNKWIGAALLLITLLLAGIAIHAQVQLRKARAVVAEDLSGSPIPDAITTNAAPALLPADDAGNVQALQQRVAALQEERDRLRLALAAAQSALVSRAQNTATKGPAR